MIERKVYELTRYYGDRYDGIVRRQWVGVITVDGTEIYNHLFGSKAEAWERIHKIHSLNNHSG